MQQTTTEEPQSVIENSTAAEHHVEGLAEEAADAEGTRLSLPHGPAGVEGKHASGDTLPAAKPDLYKVPGGLMVYDRFVRQHNSTTKPLHLWPEVWQMMSAKAKAVAIDLYKKEVEAGTYVHQAALAAVEVHPFMPTVNRF